ncbi:MAG: RNA methyltransferase [candidate division FCPU426 bacterium]
MNPKLLKALAKDPEARRQEGLCLLEGPKMALEALQAGVSIKAWVIREGSVLPKELEKALSKLPRQVLGASFFDALSEVRTSQGILMAAQIPVPKPLETPKLAVAAEVLQDPGNLGTLLRSAWAAGVDAVLLSQGCADPYSPKVLRAAAGAHWHLAIHANLDLGSALRGLAGRGVRVLGLDTRAKKGLWELELDKDPVCLVLGSEGQGLGTECLEACTETLKIVYPGKAESLNAGVSLSIALFEVLRQRGSHAR